MSAGSPGGSDEPGPSARLFGVSSVGFARAGSGVRSVSPDSSSASGVAPVDGSPGLVPIITADPSCAPTSAPAAGGDSSRLSGVAATAGGEEPRARPWKHPLPVASCGRRRKARRATSRRVAKRQHGAPAGSRAADPRGSAGNTRQPRPRERAGARREPIFAPSGFRRSLGERPQRREARAGDRLVLRVKRASALPSGGGSTRRDDGACGRRGRPRYPLRAAGRPGSGPRASWPSRAPGSRPPGFGYRAPARKVEAGIGASRAAGSPRGSGRRKVSAR